MATNLTTDNLRKSSSLNSTKYNSTLNVITADGDTLKRLPISEVVKNRIENIIFIVSIDEMQKCTISQLL